MFLELKRKSFWHQCIQKSFWALKPKSKINSRGVTLVELLVALGLSSLLLTFVFSLHLFSNKLVFNWEKKANLESIALRCMETLTKDISQIEELKQVEAKKIAGISASGKELIYEFENGNLLRNSEPLNQKEIKIESFRMSYYSKPLYSDSGYSESQKEIILDENILPYQNQKLLEKISGVKVKLTLSGYGKKLYLENFIRLKKSISVY